MRKYCKFFLTITILLILSFFVPKVEAKFMSDKSEVTYSTAEGLPTGKATSICQTESGYIWIGQYVGLTRYDSKNFTTFTSISGYDLTGVMALDSYEKELYIGTSKGLYVLIDTQVTCLTAGYGEMFINDIYASNDIIYFASTSGLYSFNKKSKVTTLLKNGNVTNISVDDTNHSRYYYVLDSNVYDNTNAGILVNSNTIYKTVFYDSETGLLYVGRLNGNLITIDPKNLTNKTEVKITDETHSINHISKYDDLLHICTDEGVFLYDLETLEKEKPNLEISNSVEDCTIDYLGNLWIVSTTQGVSCITTNTLIDYLSYYDISAQNVTAISRYKGYIYVATFSGVLVLDEETYEVVPSNLTDFLSGIRIRDLYVYNDLLFIATYEVTKCDCYFYDGENGYNISDEMLTEDGNENQLASSVRNFAEHNGSLYIGTNYGLSKLTPSDKNNDGVIDLTNYEFDLVNRRLDYRPLYLYSDDTNLYVSLEGVGLATVNDNLGTERLDTTSTHSTLKCNTIDGKLLFNDGKILYYYEDNTLKQVNYTFDGIIEEIHYLDGKYYIGADDNIYVFEDLFSESPECVRLSEGDGLKGALGTYSEGYHDTENGNNRFMFACTNGIYVLDFNRGNSSSTKLKVSIVNVELDNTTSYNSQVVSPSSNQSATFNLAVFNYSGQNYTLYYKLEGFDTDYRTITSDRELTATYTNLHGGNYTFTFYIETEEGLIIEASNPISFVKEYKAYEMPYFWVVLILIILLLIVLSGFLFYKYRTAKIISQRNEYKRITLEAIEAIARTIDAKDEYTNGHSLRVGYFSREIAKALGMSDAEVENIYYIGLLHDIGKIAIPNEVLNKEGKLTDEEYNIIKTHPVRGAKILETLSTIPNIIDGAKYHHERYDGRGYPDGLKGEEIPLVARIICCADSFDAMATRRSYKDPYSKERIISEFERCKGTQFDPIIADVTIRLIQNDTLNCDREFLDNFNKNSYRAVDLEMDKA